MVTTDEEALHELFTIAIIGITPRKQYQGAETWKPYDEEVSGASRTRRFRLMFRRPRLQPGGTQAGFASEQTVTLIVRTDYVGQHSKLQFLFADDHRQLRDVLSGLASPNNGLVLVEEVTYRERRVTEENQTDVVQVDHTFNVRFMAITRP